ncbi:MAG: Asp-tRNA(Asn)/Glu-tRNA(Gln) amidotransferase subunit GatA [bacterium]
MSLFYEPAHELSQRLRRREISSEELTREVLGRLRSVEPRVKAFNTVTEEAALEQARKADHRLAANDRITPLTGIPIALKDNLCTRGTPTTCSSKILQNYVPPYDATVVARLREAGAVFVGKTNLDEFAMGSSTENSGFQTTLNPWDLSRVPGGSSGGSAACVIAGQAILAFGSDTGGSIRQPAALCGVVGMKPTYGRVSRYGLIAFASSLDQIGPLSRDVEDCAIALNLISGHDKMDSTSAAVAVPDFAAALGKDIKKLRLGIPKEYFIEGMEREVEDSVRQAVKTLEGMGADVVEVSLPHTEYAVATYYLCATAEASSNLARYDGVHYGLRDFDAENIVDLFTATRSKGFGPEVKRRIMLGTYALSAGYYEAYYLKALKVRTLIKNDFEKAFEKCDVIATPTAPTAAFRAGEKTGDPLQMYLSDIFTISVNLAGLPGVSIPCGFNSGGLPIGLQFIAPSFEEERLVSVAHAFEQATDFHKRRPALT